LSDGTDPAVNALTIKDGLIASGDTLGTVNLHRVDEDKCIMSIKEK